MKYDATAPQTSATPGRPADANGWFNHALTVCFTGSDATSGIDSCDAAKSYGGPDTASASLGGACRDKAGNSTSGSFSLKYDGTPPSVTPSPDRAPNAAGWYRLPVTVGFTGGDATSGLESCEAAKTYSSPDSASASVAGTCRDQAANVGTGSLGLKYDATAPAPSPRRRIAGGRRQRLVQRPRNRRLRRHRPDVRRRVVHAAQNYAGPDTGRRVADRKLLATRPETATSRPLALKYDATAPQATATRSRTADANGWYNHALTVSFAGTDATSGLARARRRQAIRARQRAPRRSPAPAWTRPGNVGPTSFALKYDGDGAVRSPRRRRGRPTSTVGTTTH